MVALKGRRATALGALVASALALPARAQVAIVETPDGAALQVPSDPPTRSNADPDPVTRWRSEIAVAAARFGIPAEWIARVMRAESGGQTRLHGRLITSRAGAMGLMQLMPATWSDMRDRLMLGSNPFDPHDNILAGTGYMRMLYDRFGYPGLFAAYNAGPERYSDFVAGARPLPAETRAYVARIAGNVAKSEVPLHARRPPPLFAVLIAVASPAPDTGGSDAAGDDPTLDDPLFSLRDAP